ncbi:MAG: ezrA [Bacillales bacterium]|nr:ezrA [Bacillales bacterium]
MPYAIGAVVLIALIGFIYITAIRKRHYKDIDKLESKKIDLMNMPVLVEIHNLKNLNNSGDTEQKITTWREKWEMFRKEEFPSIENLLFEAEEATEKYRFKKSVEVCKIIAEKLDQFEKNIVEMIDEIRDLGETAIKNDLLLNDLKEQFKELKRQLIIHNHVYGKSLAHLEKEIAGVADDFLDVEHEAANGNYYNAKEKLEKIQVKYNRLVEKSQLIPELTNDCRKKLPKFIEMTKQAFLDMKKMGLPLEHLTYSEEFDKMEKELKKNLELLDEAKAFEVLESTVEMNNRLTEMCDTLSLEDESQKFIQNKQEEVEDFVREVASQVKYLRDETEKVSLNYQISAEDIEVCETLQNRMKAQREKWNFVLEQIKKKQDPYSELKTQVEEIEIELQNISDGFKVFISKLNSLRKDEMKAQQKISEMKSTFFEIYTKIKTSNLPGIPAIFDVLRNEARDAVIIVEEKMKESKLDIPNINFALEEATKKTEALWNYTNKLIEDMELAERLIQYGNRYRKQYPQLAEALHEAEQKFRNFQYSEAREIASSAIEKVKPHFELQMLESEDEMLVHSK